MYTEPIGAAGTHSSPGFPRSSQARRTWFDRAAARAAQIDAGFGPQVLADMIAALDRFTDHELPAPDGSSAAGLRAFHAAWRSELAP